MTANVDLASRDIPVLMLDTQPRPALGVAVDRADSSTRDDDERPMSMATAAAPVMNLASRGLDEMSAQTATPRVLPSPLTLAAAAAQLVTLRRAAVPP